MPDPIDKALTSLELAIIKGDHNLIERLAKRENVVNAQDLDGNTPLHKVVELLANNQLAEELGAENISTLLATGADPAIKNNFGNTAFQVYTLNNHPKLSIALLLTGSPTFFFDCVLSGNSSGLKSLAALIDAEKTANAISILKERVFMSGAPTDSAPSDSEHTMSDFSTGSSVSTIPASSHRKMTGEKTIEIRLRIDNTDNQGRTPLMLAAGSQEGGESATEALLKMGADPQAKDNNDNTALHYAASSGNADKMDHIIQYGPLFINTRNNQKKTALMLLTQESNIDEETVNILLRAGADPSCIDINGNLPIHYAAWSGNAAVIKALVNASEEIAPNPHNPKNGKTPLMILAEMQTPEALDAMRFLLSHSVDPNDRDLDGNTALHIAIEAKNYGAARLLALADKTNLNAQNKSGQTALHTAILAKDIQPEMFDLINKLASKTNLAILDQDSKNALHLAAEVGDFRVAQLLIKGEVAFEQISSIQLIGFITAGDFLKSLLSQQDGDTPSTHGPLLEMVRKFQAPNAILSRGEVEALGNLSDQWSNNQVAVGDTGDKALLQPLSRKLGEVINSLNDPMHLAMQQDHEGRTAFDTICSTYLARVPLFDREMELVCQAALLRLLLETLVEPSLALKRFTPEDLKQLQTLFEDSEILSTLIEIEGLEELRARLDENETSTLPKELITKIRALSKTNYNTVSFTRDEVDSLKEFLKHNSRLDLWEKLLAEPPDPANGRANQSASLSAAQGRTLIFIKLNNRNPPFARIPTSLNERRVRPFCLGDGRHQENKASKATGQRPPPPSPKCASPFHAAKRKLESESESESQEASTENPGNGKRHCPSPSPT